MRLVCGGFLAVLILSVAAILAGGSAGGSTVDPSAIVTRANAVAALRRAGATSLLNPVTTAPNGYWRTGARLGRVVVFLDQSRSEAAAASFVQRAPATSERSFDVVYGSYRDAVIVVDAPTARSAHSTLSTIEQALRILSA
jgi:hypothetical protein